MVFLVIKLKKYNKDTHLTMERPFLMISKDINHSQTKREVLFIIYVVIYGYCSIPGIV